MMLFWLSISIALLAILLSSYFIIYGRLSKHNTLKIERNKCSIAIDENKIIDSEKNNTISLDDNEISLATKTKKIGIRLNSISSVRIIQSKKAKYHKDNLLELSGEGELLDGSKKCFLQFTSGYELHYWKKMIKSACFGTGKPFQLATNENDNALFSSFDLRFSQQLEKTLESQELKEYITSRVREMQRIPFVKSIRICKIHFRQDRPVLDGRLIQASTLTKEQVVSAKYSVTMNDVLKIEAEAVFDFLPVTTNLHINVDEVSGEVLVNCLPPLDFWITCEKLPSISYSVYISLGFLKLPGIFILPLIVKSIMSEILSQIIISPFGVHVDKLPADDLLMNQEAEYSEGIQSGQQNEEDKLYDRENTEERTDDQESEKTHDDHTGTKVLNNDESRSEKMKKSLAPKKTKQEKIHDQVERQREKERDKILKKEIELEEKEKKKQEKLERKVQKGKDLRAKELEKSFERLEKLLKKDEEKKSKKLKDSSDEDYFATRSGSVTPKPELSPCQEESDDSKKKKKKRGHGKQLSHNEYEGNNERTCENEVNVDETKENVGEDLHRHHRHKSSHSSLKERAIEEEGSRRRHTRHSSNREGPDNSQ